ncbi:MAG: ParB/RepB/Spo0J family partition protein [Thaumarchaeota archaeon S14]|nr:MAG: ParB/RepB/Spo0J family partition protein [Thaumarchaeota archaeon S14]
MAYRLREIPVKEITVWRDAQARRLDREGIAELAKSIKHDGLQNPPMVQKSGPGQYLLMSGQRRLAALKRLRAKKIPALVLTKQSAYDVGDAKAASVVENLHRRGMKSRDMASACAFLAERMPKTRAAQMLGISLPTFKKLHGFAGVPEALKELTPKVISRDDATNLYQAAPSVAKAIKVAEKITKLDAPTRRRYIKAYARSPRSSHKALLKRARATVAQQKVRLELTKGNARKLASKSRKRDVTPDELAGEIVSRWLRSH